MTKGNLIVISGPSGTGKGVVCKRLLKQNNNLAISISMTTRDPRKGEVDGREYYFVSREKFEDEIAKGGLLEYANVFDIGNYYGTPKNKVLEELERGKDIILEIDIEGGRQVKQSYEDAVMIFLAPPNMNELRNRIIKRGTERKEVIDKRLAEAIKELEAIDEYDYLIVNDKIEDATKKIEAILIAEKTRVTKGTFREVQEMMKEER